MKYIRLYLCSPDRHAAILAGMTPAEEEYRDIPVPTFEELTVEQYGRLTTSVDGEAQHQTIARIFGLPEHLALALTVAERGELMEFLHAYLKDTAKAWADLGKAKEALKAVTEEHQRRPTPADIRAAMEGHGLFRSHIEAGGRRFVVPQELENTTKWGQWITAQSAIEEHVKSKDPDWKLWPKLLAVFCLEAGERWPTKADGEDADEFDERFGAWLGARQAIMQGARFVDAMAVTAFFFSTSTEFARIMLPHTTNTHGSPMPWPRPRLTSTASGGV